ncbi:putative thiazole-containing bacteriocin maturation protein [Brevibacillus sp. MER 51]|uniref:putative thiazole-containing bacteriocin maturation protein n=1 Tax=Brevibacillus sp. MER 51 TaxID=2939560 RepID=UPI00203E6F97|nr:putative thiazole-containing bacteriocin maturation protein [Brevibacillus sp. MER 51]MCM3140739.1 putative thiazole-containing bacteriocin maturation protein [Brevibacillus sp. MER 51]
MVRLNPSMRIKVKRDTVYLPDSDGSVYFRNNIGTFRMKGDMIDRWVDQLMPMFNGEYTLAQLTDDLPEEYQQQIYQVADTLLQNGFLQDISREKPHELSPEIMSAYAEQIEFLDQFGGSGGYLFQKYRTEKVLIIGAGSFLLSVAHALLESGCVQFHYVITNEAPTNRGRLDAIIEHARRKDAQVKLEELKPASWGIAEWSKAIEPFAAVLYTSAQVSKDEMSVIHSACRERQKVFVPAVCLMQKGIAGPLIHPESAACLESAWRRLHRQTLCADPDQHPFSMTAAAMLANIAVFEWFKHVTGVNEAQNENKVYVLNLETLEGSWRSFLPHPMVNKEMCLEILDRKELESRLADKTEPKEGLQSVFQSWTSSDTGIFHSWEEGELIQLPLTQCMVTAVDPVSEGPAELMSPVVCPGYTHEEARREAGLLGVEKYVGRLVNHLATTDAAFRAVGNGNIGVGAGETPAEGLNRALRHCLTIMYASEMKGRQPTGRPVRVDTIADEPCQFYVRSFTTLGEKPIIAKGYEVCGFPVYWVGTLAGWYGSIGLQERDALRSALMFALQQIQTPSNQVSKYVLTAQSVGLTGEAIELALNSVQEESERAVWIQALEVLALHHLTPLVMNAAIEPFLEEDLGGVFALQLSREVPNDI